MARRWTDALLAALVAALFAVQIATERAFTGERGPALAIAAAFSLALVWRRSAPLLALVLGLELIVGSNQIVPALGNTGTFFAAYVLATYSAGRYSEGRLALAAALVLAVAFPFAAIEPGQPFSVSDAALIAVAFAGPFVAGQAHRRHLHGRARALERERDGTAG